MKPFRWIATIVLTGLVLQTAPVSAAVQARRQDERDGGRGRSVQGFQSDFLRKTRLLQHKQEMANLREEIRTKAHRKSSQQDSPNPPAPLPPPNDPYYATSGAWAQSYADLWGIERLGLDESEWRWTRGEGITIAVVDTGVDYRHEDLSGNIWQNQAELNGLPGVDDDGDGYVDDFHGWDFIESDNDPMDLYGHGTHVAGIAAATGYNSKGIIGVAPLADILPVRVLDQYGSGTIEGVAAGIEYAARAGADVINLSLGAFGLDAASQDPLQRAVDYALSLGSVVVAAAGNFNDSVDLFTPANLNGVIAVGAVDADDQRAGFSNYGSKLFITAPGVDILSLGHSTAFIGVGVSDGYYRASGTSMATSFVSGTIALMLKRYPGASPEFIRSRLASSAKDLGAAGWDPYYGYGRVDAAAALDLPGFGRFVRGRAGFEVDERLDRRKIEEEFIRMGLLRRV